MQRQAPALQALAPTQSESPFVFTQLVVLALFVMLGIVTTDQIPRRSCIIITEG
ncbi:MAG: hypothetical protein HYR56_21665 [Acidobacteria bacterium]|nr:hypothetical protein [Acidobacteriota bacterium]MBI3427649.1 hypothetical protein [Acidobacteriota bacterium]